MCMRRSEEHHENAICTNFYFFDPKQSQIRRFLLSVYNTDLCKGRSTKEAIVSFFRRAP